MSWVSRTLLGVFVAGLCLFVFGPLLWLGAHAFVTNWTYPNLLPDGFTLLGAAIIVGSGLYVLRHEQAHATAEHP